MAFDIDDTPEATNTITICELEFSGLGFQNALKNRQFIMLSKCSVSHKLLHNVPQPTCVGILGFASGGAHACGVASCPAVPPTKQVWLAG